MVVSTSVVARRYEDVSAGTPISVDIPAYEVGDVYVYYGNASLVAVQGTDYTVALAGDFETFTVTPTASLLTKINALIAGDPTEENYITVRRALDYLTDATPDGVRYTPFTSREFDRNAMRDMQLADERSRSVRLSEKFAPPYPELTIADWNEGEALVFGPNGELLGAPVGEADIALAVAAAKTARDEAVAAAGHRFNSLADLTADTLLTYIGGGAGFVVAGGLVQAGRYMYEVAPEGATDADMATAGGVKLYYTDGHGASKYDVGVPLVQIGAIRNNGDKSDAFNHWKLIENGSHTPLGFRNASGDGLEIETTDSLIRIHHDVGGDYVGGLIASVDETLAQTGLRLGCSVGVASSDIWLYRDFMAQVYRSSGGAWVHDLNNAEPFTAAWNASGYLDITFPDTPSAIGIVQQIGSVEIGEWRAQFQQISATSARIHFFRAKPKKHSGRIRWNSGFSVVSGSTGITIGTFSGGLLPVAFTGGDVNDFDIQVTPGGGMAGIGYQCQIRNPGPTGFDLQWVDNTGAIVTTADNKMEAFVSAISRSQAEQPSPSTAFAVRVLSRSNLNPKSIDTVAYPAGNIWLSGAVVQERT